MTQREKGDLELAGGNLSLASIEKMLRWEGYEQAAIDATLAFIIDAREALAAAGQLPRKDPRPS